MENQRMHLGWVCKSRKTNIGISSSCFRLLNLTCIFFTQCSALQEDECAETQVKSQRHDLRDVTKHVLGLHPWREICITFVCMQCSKTI